MVQASRQQKSSGTNGSLQKKMRLNYTKEKLLTVRKSVLRLNDYYWMGNRQRGSDKGVISMLEASKMRHVAGKPLQNKCPAPGPKEIDAHQRKENCRADTAPEDGLVSQALGLCPSGMRRSLAQTTSLLCHSASFPTILLQWKVVVTDFVVI